MEELTVGSDANLVNDSWLQVHKHSSGNMFTRASLREEGVEAVISSGRCLLIWRHGSIRLDAMFQTVEFPTGIANLATSLANMDWDTLTLQYWFLIRIENWLFKLWKC